MKIPPFVLTPLIASLALNASLAEPVGTTRVLVVFAGGHETDGRDGGRPVVLVAAGLGVPAEVFRETFTHVHPAHGGGGPSPEEARANKTALMAGLGKYGLTNDRLDEVSNYYRYVRSRGELWTNHPATANALVCNGVVTGFEITDGGAGYSSAPSVSVPEVGAVPAAVELSFGKDLKRNGSISAIKLTPLGAK